MKNLKLSRFSLYLLSVFLITAYVYQEQCFDIVLIEYLRHYFFDIGRIDDVTYQIQFVNEGTQSNYCYFTIQEKYFDIYENKYVYFTYFPRVARIIFNQSLVFFIARFVLVRKNTITQNLKSINLHFILVLFLGLIISVYSINRTTSFFENDFMLYLFIIFSALKCLIVFQYLQDNNFHLKLLIFSCFPLVSTGFGIPWLFDFLVYYTLFSMLGVNKYKKENILYLVIFSLTFSLIYPALNSPSVETQIIENNFEFKAESNFNEVSIQRNTFLETKDLEYLANSQTSEDIRNEVFNLSRYLKEIKYPGRYMFLISIFPDIQNHIPALIWYLSFILLFFNIFKYLKNNQIKHLSGYLENSSKLLITYQLLSIFLGVNTFFNSFSSFLFSLSRNAELITFGINQTWRGVASHYELFSNLQLISFCFFLLTYQVTRKNIYLIFSLVSIYTTFLSQSRWNSLLVFIILVFIVINFYKKFPLQIIFVILFSILIIQNIPVFERDEPFFIYPDGVEEKYKHNPSYSLGIIEPITDRLNRTLPWKMFASGYEPNIISLTFGHGPASYLNIVKNSETLITSGPHSSLLLIFNKFGLVGIFVVLIISYVFINESFKKLPHNEFIWLMVVSILMLSLEVKTDTLLLTDGVAVFFFNLFIIKFFQKTLIGNNWDKM